MAVDVEDNKLGNLDKQDLTDLTAYALHEVEQMGFYAQLYTYTSFAKAHLFVGGAALHPYDVWLADYTGKTPKVDFKYNAHQHQQGPRAGHLRQRGPQRDHPQLPENHPQEGPDPSSGGRMSDAIIVAIITGGLSLIGVIVSNNHTAQSMDAKLDKQQAVTETKLEELTREVRTHNNFAQRIPVLEEQMKVANHRIEDLEKRGRRVIHGSDS